MSTLNDYVGRLNDLCILDGVEDPNVELRLDLFNSMCTGVQKLAQKVISLLLTVKGSVLGEPDRGTDFLADLYANRFQTATDVGVAFGAAVLDITNQLNAVTTDETPDDEVIESIIVQSVTLNEDQLVLSAQIQTADPSRKAILPISIPLAVG